MVNDSDKILIILNGEFVGPFDDRESAKEFAEKWMSGQEYAVAYFVYLDAPLTTPEAWLQRVVISP